MYLTEKQKIPFEYEKKSGIEQYMYHKANRTLTLIALIPDISVCTIH